MKQDKPGANPSGKTPYEKDLYFYHPDHLGSSNAITDTQGQLYEHLEYFPFGETWVEESSNTQRTPYLFTAKELDRDIESTMRPGKLSDQLIETKPPPKIELREPRSSDRHDLGAEKSLPIMYGRDRNFLPVV